ncbi:MAG: hypothetical protein EP329_16465 [Deltaproteobacteria bacterium]|nr:MAG: hypothetical protein EP329_16465 [Deltaproteobacteria bacterium]
MRERWPLLNTLALVGAVTLTTFLSAACGDDGAAGDDTVATDAADVSPDDTADGADTASTAGDEVYFPVAPPAEVPEALDGDRWITHYVDDIAPYWATAEALGTPVGNFPTYRGMDGRVLSPSERRPRMISRQILGYALGYLLTGERSLLEHAQAGADWLRAHAIDRTKGGCREILTADGGASGSVRTAQDLSYCMTGLAALFFVTRDPALESELEAARGWLFDPAKYWDAENGRVRDALADDMTTEVDVESDGGWELVAQLDPVNAFMLLAQPVMSTEAARKRFLDGLKTLVQVMIDDFWQDGIFWGVSTNKGQYGTKHVDWGHTLKSYWMVLQVDKRLPDHPFHDLVFDNVYTLVDRAFDADNGRWSKRPTSATAVEYGSDWWIYAEEDQVAATLDLIDHRYTETLGQTAGHWLTDYVDQVYDIGEIIPGIKRDGSPVWSWPATDNAKCNQWKSAFHSSEHALVMSILGQYYGDGEVELHFAVPAADVDTFIAKPYTFDGRVVAREAGESFTLGGRELTEVTVKFRDLY